MRVPWSIGTRIVLAAVVPLIILAFCLSVFYARTQFSDIQEVHSARAESLARHLAVASEYPIFSGNRRTLQHLAQSTLAEHGVAAISIRDVFHVALATAHQPGFPTQLLLSNQEREDFITIRADILPSSLALDDNYDPLPSPLSMQSYLHPLGSVVLYMSKAPIEQRQAEILHQGIAVALLVLLAAFGLAYWLSRNVADTISRIAEAVQRIGRGNFSERVPEYEAGSLKLLTAGVNDMASELAEIHANLQHRIDAATAEINAGKNQAIEDNHAKSRFLAAASHDLRQPMHALGLTVAQLSTQTLPVEAEALVQKISRATSSMANLLDSLLDISRLDIDTVTPTLRRFAINDMFDRLDSAYASLAEAAGVHLFLRHSDAWTESDPLLLDRIIGNLISNAIRYAPKGRVLVACRRRNGKLHIEVRDNGIGINPKDQQQIFKEFFQLNNPERAQEKGLGLGLSITERLSKILNHPISLRSEPGKGTVFICEIPDGQTSSPRLTERPPGDLEGLRVCLLENDPLALESLESLLRSWRCEVYSAPGLCTSGPALTLPPQPPDVIISELHLIDDSNGLTAIDSLRTLFGFNIPAALTTSDSHKELAQTAQTADVVFMLKPVTPARLRAFLQRINVPGADSDLGHETEPAIS